METSKSKSLFRDITSRELNGFRVRKRPYIWDTVSDFTEIVSVAVEHNGEETPPLGISFCKTSKNSHIFAVTDEDGYVSLFDTRRKFHSFGSHEENADKARISDWVAHQNAIFDVCWTKEDANLLTASGDQTIKVWDVQVKKCTGVLMGHTGSVKSLCLHPTNSDLLVSGSRDGSFAIWDLRCKGAPKSRCGEACITSTSMVKGAHVSPLAKRVKRIKAASMSITSVLYLKDEVSIATAGAVDSVVKFWDTRHLKFQVTQACPHPTTEKERRFHGISSLSQDLNGVFLTASCMDNRIYMYNVLQLERGPMRSFSGCRIESFYVKSAISPDAAHMLSGSSDGNAYIWKVKKPEMDPIKLKSHDGEVTAVDWCPSEEGKIATSSDDFTVRIWNMCSNYFSRTRLPSSIRRRIMAIPSEECQKILMDKEKMNLMEDWRVMAIPSEECQQILTDKEKMNLTEDCNNLMAIPSKECQKILMDKEKMNLTEDCNNLHSTDEVFGQINSLNPITIPTVSTPEAQKKKFSAGAHSKETSQKTPEAAMKSPSSVLNPPSSLKRTIRDYFLLA